MYIHEMISETKQLREHMTPDNEVYFGEMVRYFRGGSSQLTEAKGEELLLQIAKQIMKNQEKGIPASQVFGEHPIDYCKQLVEDVTARKPRSLQDKIKYYTMIPWVALTWVFFIYMITGFFSKWFGGELEYTLISSASLILIAGLSIVAVELVTKYLAPGRNKKESEPRERTFDPKTLGIYIGAAALLLVVGLLLGSFMPSFTVSPWDSLIIFVVGVVGQKFIFGRDRKLQKQNGK